MRDYVGADDTEDSVSVGHYAISLPLNHLVRHLGHVRDGVCVVHQLSLVHFNFSQPAVVAILPI